MLMRTDDERQGYAQPSADPAIVVDWLEDDADLPVGVDAKAREARQFALPPPESEEAASARRKHDSDRLRLADRQFRQRQASLGTERRALPRSTGSRQGQTSNSKEAAERALAAKLNAARIGNCTTPRPEANCL